MLLAFSMDTLYSKIHFPRGTFIKYLDNKTKELSHRGNLIERSSFISHKHPIAVDGIALLLHKMIMSVLLKFRYNFQDWRAIDSPKKQMNEFVVFAITVRKYLKLEIKI